jgi:hypothetical protein
MAKIKNNLFLKGASGTIGDQVTYRQMGDETVVSAKPVMDPNRKPTEKQTEHRGKFSDAAAYATEALESEELKAEYAKTAPRGKSAYNMAVSDYFNAPVVKKISLANNVVSVLAKDDFRVASLQVSILSAGGEVLEEGEAVPNSVNREKWTYTTSLTTEALAGATLRAAAKDLPGNEGTLDIAA